VTGQSDTLSASPIRPARARAAWRQGQRVDQRDGEATIKPTIPSIGA
jgi:hypothetical protein